jgi:hypothetical protein
MFYLTFIKRIMTFKGGAENLASLIHAATADENLQHWNGVLVAYWQESWVAVKET